MNHQKNQAQNRKEHDLKGALRTFEAAISELKDGTFFDNGQGDVKIKSMERAMKVLQKELSSILGPLDME